MLITPQGSTFFIGEVFTTLALSPDIPLRDMDCAQCNLCVKSCPTNALETPYVLNANTIEHWEDARKQTAWDASVKKHVNHYIYGCDICQQVCPYNAKRKPTTVTEFNIKPEILNFTNTDWKSITEHTFERIFADSAVKRIGYEKFKENIRLAKERLE